MGHSIKRKEDPRFVRGQGTYVDDIRLPGMIYLDIVRSPFAHATIKKINPSKALSIPGVLAVITGQDLAKYNLHWMQTLMSDTQMVLPVDKVMFQSKKSPPCWPETGTSPRMALKPWKWNTIRFPLS